MPEEAHFLPQGKTQKKNRWQSTGRFNSDWFPTEGLCYHLRGNLDVLVRAEANWDLTLFPVAQHTRQHPVVNSFNSILEFRLTLTPLPSHYPRAFLLLIQLKLSEALLFPSHFPLPNPTIGSSVIQLTPLCKEDIPLAWLTQSHFSTGIPSPQTTRALTSSCFVLMDVKLEQTPSPKEKPP